MQTTTIRRAVLQAVAASLLLSSTIPLHAADFPTKPVKVIVSFPPAGLTDVVARLISARLSERLKQPVVVENKPGAGGVIGTEFTAKAPGDGYTMTFTANNHVIQPHLSKNMRYDVRKDFTPIAMIGNLPSALIVKSALQVTSVAQLLAYARANPGKLSYGSWGMGTSAHVRTEMFKAENKIDLLHVPFQGAAPALTGVMGGQVDLMIIPLSLVENLHKDGRIRIIGVTTEKRSPLAPEVPTLKEQNIVLNGASWQGFIGPANMPADVVALLNREISATVEEPSIRALLTKNGIEVLTNSQPEFKAYLDSEYDYWAQAIRTAKIVIE